MFVSVLEEQRAILEDRCHHTVLVGLSRDVSKFS